ncbi:TonB-dependent receptor [Sphingomonas jeddahensis]|uniref:Catecholate siderophore receptor CirA n=1 Tax=Sphingomonas jeddahensis TaxID=1915074 RepID=A0A1V2EU77_9SPHN|nr:TonB-dependent receptor [Sphingomonas jeddahensis]ONF96035.1 catecholate siderophore receptor CirA [Sphingomonas jeddahensis]
MGSFAARSLSRFVIGASVVALATAPGMAWAQDAAATVGNPGPSETESLPQNPTEGEDDIVVTGIRASLRATIDIKRDAQGVVDAISAEDIGKFPDTNLAESLQRITGVSIDRSNGEGSFVTVRGFGPEYNLVTLNGRQMPTSSLGDGASAPASRSFDFANLASEGISAVEVYKTGRASVPSGGIGSSINIRTPRPLDKPGMRGSIAAKGVLDSSQNGKNQILPEVSGIFSTTFADDRVGIMVNGIYQRRKASANEAFVGFRDGFLGSGDGWGVLPNNAQQANRPTGNDVYEIPQEASYNVRDIDRERINGQAVIQVKPTDTLTATADFTYSRNKVEVRNNSVGVWFNFGDVSSEWTDGPIAGPVFYSEAFAPGKDLSYSAALSANVTENKSLGFNLNWEAPGGVTVSFDAHHSTAESKPTNDYGTSTNIGSAVFGVARQTINFENDLPIISYSMQPGIDPLNASLATPTGNSFRNAYFRDEINQFQIKGRYEHDGAFLDSIDFGFSYVDNQVRSAYGFIQNETWGGIDPRGASFGAAAVPDDFWKLISLPDKFQGVQGAGNAAVPQQILGFNFEQMAELLRGQYNICSNPQIGTSQAGTCLADFTTDRRIREKTISPYLQVNTKFDLLEGPAHIIAGVRYDQTTVSSRALVQVPTGTRWTAANEFALSYAPERSFLVSKGSYQNWLPSIDFDMEPIRNVKLRASYSHTITRADYGSLQGGLELASNPRIGGGTGTNGNPNLIPFKSKNIDLSAEWYYQPESYISVGYFNKDVQNFIATTQINQSAFELRNPGSGPRYRAAQAALGGTTDAVRIRDYILRNFPASSQVTGVTEAGGVTYLNGNIFGLPEDDLFNFQVNQPFNSDQTANINGWEFALQHRFWDTGFGTILNYTIVNGDAQFNNALDPSVSQFALVGLSDSANAVLFFDKFGFQARGAYNWRASFLNSNNGFDPTYVESYGQFDASISYELIPGLTVFGEGINLTGSSRRGHRRSNEMVTFSQPGFARYTAGVRFNF